MSQFTTIHIEEPEVPKTPPLSERQTWKTRLDALRNFPRVLKVVWEAAPAMVATGLLLRVGCAVIPVYMLNAGRHIIDLVTESVKSGAGATDAPGLWYWLMVEFILASTMQVVGRMIDYCDGRMADEFTRHLSLRIMQHAASLDLASFEDASFHDKLERARVQATDRVNMLTSAGWLVQRTVMLITLGGAIIMYSPWLFVVLVLCVIPIFLGEGHFAFLGYAHAHRLTPIRRQMDYLLTLGSSREAAKEVKMFGLSDHLRQRLYESSEVIIRDNMRLARRRLAWGSLLAFLGTVGYYGCYAFVARQALLGRISVGDLTFLAGAIAGASGHLREIFSLFSNIADQALFLTDLFVFFDMKPRIASKPMALPAPRPIRSGFEFENVSFHYPGSSRLALRNFNFRIDQGERVALVGENGQGKTTFVKLLTRLYDPTEGRILLDGVDLREYDVADLRREIGVIFQDFLRYDMTVRENVGVGKIEVIKNDSAIWRAVNNSSADELLSRLPNDLDQMLGRRFEGGVDLSGGEWQKIALARAYLREAQLLILDEPTAALDAIAELEVFSKFAELTKDRMALFISHRFSTVKMADRIVVLGNGRIQEEGTHRQLMALGRKYAEMFEIQAASYR